MAYEIEIKEAQPQPVVSIRVTTSMAEISSVMGQLYGEVFGYLGSIGVAPAGAPFARYHSVTQDAVDMDVGVAVTQSVEGKGRIAACELAGGRLAVTWHVGPYDTIAGAYEALQAWMAEQGVQPAGPSWEVYWTDPQQVPDPSQWRTEVIWPIA